MQNSNASLWSAALNQVCSISVVT